jgi:hypothetical protein
MSDHAAILSDRPSRTQRRVPARSNIALTGHFAVIEIET